MATVNASFSRVPAKAVRAKLRQTDWAVIHAIGLHADKDGRAFPSMARIAEIVGIQRNNIPRSIGRLEERGLLRRKRLPKPNGGWQVSHYELVFDPLGDVISPDDIPREDVMQGDTHASSPVMTGCHLHRRQGVISSDALTDHRRDSYQEEGVQEAAVEGRVESKSGVGVMPSDDTPHHGPTCPWYVTNDHGFRICNKPALPQTGLCPDHTPGMADAPFKWR